MFKPMLCESLFDRNDLNKFDNSRFLANEKFDGCRCLAFKEGEKIILFGRNNTIITSQFPEIVEDLKKFDVDFIVDGEVISTDEKFNSLQRRALTKDKAKREKLIKEIPCRYMIFDILSCERKAISKEPLRDRVKILNDFFYSFNSVNCFLVEYEDIFNCLKKVEDKNGEGIIVKDMNASYESKRSKSWLKFKLFKEGYLMVDAYTINPKGIRATDSNFNAVQIAGKQSEEVKNLIDKNGYANISIQYLEKTKEERYRFISYRGLAK